MRRREFFAALGGAAAWPVVGRAQQSGAFRRIGALMNRTANDPEASSFVGAFAQGLAELGWTIGRNVRIEYRWGANDVDLDRRYAAELVALAPDVILAAGTQSVAALQRVTRTLPIVFVTVTDPVGAGLVDNLSQPGGNTTGFMLFEYSLSEMAGTPQANCARRDASCCPSRSHQSRRKPPVRRSPGRCAVDRSRDNSAQRTRRGRDRARRHSLRAPFEWRPGRDRERVGLRLY
jgi:ABC transporter substrate binding protein